MVAISHETTLLHLLNPHYLFSTHYITHFAQKYEMPDHYMQRAYQLEIS